ncbi:hypothetical protein BDN72DRAFT_847783 [Pluteus cervinus]|uniref:Uncharacterized protein n=1 Tax=Pluteus cervinus TaxID=181527 RepID=A0ACD3AC00_9AGAR|nr:hypothetical protein BDN72DRAFT_847783 [Pluteus cervinus]
MTTVVHRRKGAFLLMGVGHGARGSVQRDQTEYDFCLSSGPNLSDYDVDSIENNCTQSEYSIRPFKEIYTRICVPF